MKGFLLALVLSVFSFPAYSSIVKVIATGTIYEYEDSTGSFNFGSVILDSTVFTLTMTMDLSAVDSFPDDPTIGLYFNAVSSMSLKINGQTKVMSELGRTNVNNDWETDSGNYQELIWSIVQDGDPFGVEETMWIVTSATSTSSPTPRPPLDSDVLIPHFMSDDWLEWIDYFIEDKSQSTVELRASLRGLVDAIEVVPVPIPAAFWLFGLAISLLGWMRRKTTQFKV